MMRIRLMQIAWLRELLRRRLRGALLGAPSGVQRRLKFAATALAATLAAGALAAPAAAVPINNLTSAAPLPVNRLQPVAWVCGPFRCWWRPGPYYWGAPYGYGPPAYGSYCNPYYRYCYYR